MLNSVRPRSHALQSAEVASLRYDIEHLDQDDRDPQLDIPLAERARVAQPVTQEEEDSAIARYFARYPKPRFVPQEAPAERATNRFAPRASDHSDKILGHLDDEVLLQRVLPALRSDGQEYWFGFDEFAYFRDVGVVTRVVNYVENSTLDTVLVDEVFTPLIEERMGGAYPRADRFLLTTLIRFSVVHLWDWKKPAHTDDVMQGQHRLITDHPASESLIRRFLREASAIPNELRERLIRCNMLLQLVERSEKVLVWGFPESLTGLDTRVFMPIVASMPIGESFSMYLRQIFISRQLRLLGSRRKARLEEMQIVAVSKLDIEGLMRNLDRVFERLRFHYNTFTYFHASYVTLCNRMLIDFTNLGGSTSMTKLKAWMYYSIDKTDMKVMECMKDCDDLLLAHVVNVMGQRWGVPVRSVSSIPRELAVHVPELARKAEEKKARRNRTNAVIEAHTLAPSERKLTSARDSSPKRTAVRRSETKCRRLDPSQLSRMDRKMLSWRLSSEALKQGPEADTGVFLSASSSLSSGSYASGSSNSSSGLSEGGGGLLGSLDRSGSAVSSRVDRIAVRPPSDSDDEEEAAIERVRATLNQPKRRGRPKGARNRPKRPDPNAPF